MTTRKLTFEGLTELRNATDRVWELAVRYTLGDADDMVQLALEYAVEVEDAMQVLREVFGRDGTRRFLFDPAWVEDIRRASRLFTDIYLTAKQSERKPR